MLLTVIMAFAGAQTAGAQLENLTYNTAGGYYEIQSVADLEALASYYHGYNDGNGKVFKMMQDIDLAGVNTSFLPIASAFSNQSFVDEFDGNGFAIKNLSLVRGGNNIGLFSRLASTAIVKNLTLKDCDVRYTGTQYYVSVGAIAGVNYGTIQNCTVTGTVSNYDNQYDVGAIVGSNYSPGKVKDCTAIAGQPVVGTLYSTGSTPGTVTNCKVYYRLLTTSAVGLATTPAATTVAGTACYSAGTALALTVTPNDGTQMLTDVTFTGTTATKTAYGQYSLTIPANDVSVTASLADKITVASASGGSVIPSTYSPAVGSQVTLTLAPNTGYALTTIAATAGGTALTLNGSGLTRTFTMPDKPVSIMATFSAVSYTVSGLGSTTGGSISGPGTAHYGEEVMLTAAPATGYSLQSLTVTTAGNQNVAISGSGITRTFTMPAENVTVSATFALTQYTVHISAYNCTTTATPNPATMGQTVTLSITPDAGATLQRVEVRDASHLELTTTGSGLTRTFTMPVADAYVTVACSVSGQLAGNGTQDEPYLLFNEADLRLLSNLSKTDEFNRKYFRLESDIVMSDTPMLPIGYNFNGKFGGHFDGNGHTISNLHISGKVSEYTSLFGMTAGTISNLTLTSCTITGNESGQYYVAAIVGHNNGNVSNCHVNSGTISATAAERVGGIVGYNNEGTVSGCTNGATVSLTDGTGEENVGGIVGFIGNNGTVKDCANTGNVSISGTGYVAIYYCGGIAGHLYSGIVSGCANTGSVSATGSNAYNYAGGVVGSINNSADAICIGNTNGGAVTAANGNKNLAGGIVGFYGNSSYILKNNYYFGACTAKGSAGYVESGDAPQQDITANYGAVPGIAITKPAEVTLSSIEGYADVAHPAYAASGETVSFTIAATAEGYAATVKYNDGSDHTLTATNGVYSFTMPAKAVTITVTIAPDPAQFAQSGDTYTIYTAGGWNVFCNALQDNTTYNRFSGKTVYLGNDISVTRMAGSKSHDFCGTFDGNKKTLTFTSTENVNGVAPFSYVSETTPTGGNEVSHPVIRNLNVVADINTKAQYASGLVGLMWGTLTIEDCTVSGTIQTSAMNAAGFIADQNGDANITDCRSSVAIKSSVEGDGTHGGFVAVNNKSTNLTIEGCVFDGKLLTTNSTTKCGGFIGWRAGTAEIHNSLFDPATPTGSETWVGNTESATFARNNVDTYNCYYTYLLCDGTNYKPQYVEATETAPAVWRNGKAACTAAAAPVGSATHAKYCVSGITPYANGLQRTVGDAITFYYGGGDNVSVSFVNENGGSGTHEATVLDGSQTGIAGWYFVGKDINSQKITLSDDATIILGDGCTMSIGTSTNRINNSCIFNNTGKGLTIYGQSGQSGTLNAYNAGNTTTVFMYHYTQHGGNVTFDGTYSDILHVRDGDITLTRGTLNVNCISPHYAIKLDASPKSTAGALYVSGGTLNATTGNASAILGDLNMTGGTVNATGQYGIKGNVTFSGGILNATGTTTNSTAIYGIYGDATFSWTSAADRITVSRYRASNTFTIADGQAFTDGTNIYSGTLSSDDKTAIAGKTLQPVLADILTDDTNNTTTIQKLADNLPHDIMLLGRKLYKDGAWNTLCLPFSTALTGDLANADIRALSSASLSDEGVLTLNFTAEGAITSITAGQPYIVKWTGSAGQYVENPVFTSVTISSTAPADVAFTGVAFKGTYDWQEYTTVNKSILFLGTDNMLYYPQPSGGTNPTIGAFRAYFELSGTTQARQFVLNFGDGSEDTGIVSISKESGNQGNNPEFLNSLDYYTLDGVKLDGKPTKKGLYIHGGKRVVIK